MVLSQNIVVGFDDVVLNVLDELRGGHEYLQCIFIYGMPGLGKTTLAKNLYNHGLVNDHFDKLVWCTVSETHQMRKSLIEILTCLIGKLDDDKMKMEDENLALEIHKTLKGRRYFMLFDDLWDSKAWEDLQRYFPDDANGSRILLTSRNKDAAPVNSVMHTLPLLSEDQSWELLEKKIFQKEPCIPHLLDIRKQIAANCNVLPLAIVVVAGVLENMEKETSEWKKVEEGSMRYIFGDPSDCTRILDLSYRYLPDHLKLCFLYLGAFPEDTIIHAWQLT